MLIEQLGNWRRLMIRGVFISLLRQAQEAQAQEAQAQEIIVIKNPEREFGIFFRIYSVFFVDDF